MVFSFYLTIFTYNFVVLKRKYRLMSKKTVKPENSTKNSTTNVNTTVDSRPQKKRYIPKVYKDLEKARANVLNFQRKLDIAEQEVAVFKRKVEDYEMSKAPRWRKKNFSLD